MTDHYRAVITGVAVRYGSDPAKALALAKRLGLGARDLDKESAFQIVLAIRKMGAA